MNILEALDDPGTFAPHFAVGEWSAWRAFMAALFALVMTEDEFATYMRHTGRTDRPVRAFVEAVLIVGRRGGKSRVLAAIAVFLALRDYTRFLASGEVATIAVLAADRKQARTIMRYVTALLMETPRLKGLVTDLKDESVTLRTRVVIEVATASMRTTRGYTFAAILCDEIAFWRTDEGSAEPDVEILRALRGGMLTIPGAMLLLASSPYAQKGALWERFRKYHGQDGAPVLVWKAATSDMNPAADPEEIAQAYADDPVAAAAEYGGEFRSDVQAFMSREAVEAAIVPGRRELPPLTTIRYFAFVDPSGGSSDAMTLAIAHKDGDRAVLDLVREVRPKFSPDAVTAEFAAVLKTYRCFAVTGDRYGAAWVPERFAVHGIKYEATEKFRSDLYLELLAPLNSGRVELLDLPKLTAELCGLERHTSRSGKDSIDHPRGAHDDVANAAAGALVKALGGRGPMKISPEVLERARTPPPRSARPFMLTGRW